jgi:hypothetical protein
MAPLKTISDEGFYWASSPRSEIFEKIGHLRREAFMTAVEALAAIRLT